ncbi:unnamed protein product [Nezara viridula]|uniref:Peptidase A1 domain-containing protein n=1 Tax=Nezara viridula TaxID=85310 RepID=A0A9P0HIA7_NEZVI|nr:unnamed protein product [Nezara viridula]
MIPKLIVCFLSLIVFVSSEPISISLNRLRSPLKFLLANHEEPRYKKIIQHLEDLKDAPHTVPLFKFLDYEFYGDVLIGHPGQRFKVVFDTSWGDLWVPSILCPVLDIACINKNKYDSAKSSTYKPTGKKFNVNLGSYNITGKISSDLVQIGQINITGQTFGEVMSLPYQEYLFSKADGIFGLSFDAAAVSDGITPFFYNMIKQKTVKKEIFSFYFNRDLSTDKGGALLLGDVDPKHYRGNFTYVRVDPRSGYWQIPVDGVYLKTSQGKTQFCKGGCKAIFDTSTNEIRGPTEEIHQINQLLKARRFYFNRFIIDCGRVPMLPHITFVIGKQLFELKGPDFVQKMSWGPVTVCLSSFTPYEGGSWTLGGAFMSQYYTLFDMENYQIGLAIAR